MINYKKITAALCGFVVAGVTAAGCFSPPVKVHADLGAFAGAVDYITALSGVEATSFFTSAGGPVVSGIILGAQIALHNPVRTETGVGADSFSTISGLYTDLEGNAKIGCVCSCSYSYTDVSTSDGVPFAYGEDFELVAKIFPPSGGSVNSFNTSFYDNGNLWFYTGQWTTSGGNVGYSVTNNVSSDILQGTVYSSVPYYARDQYFQLNIWKTGAPRLDLTLQQFVDGALSSNNRPDFLGSGYSGTLPGGSAQVDSSYEEYVVNYIKTEYPDFEYIFPEEPTEEPTLDPSETMPGLPIIELPTVPPPEYDLELPEKMLEGAGFWFTALTEVLEEMGWLAIVIALAAIAVVLYYVF